MSGLKAKYKTVDPAIKQLELENSRLKNIIAKQALEIEVKDELLKKAVKLKRYQRLHSAL